MSRLGPLAPLTSDSDDLRIWSLGRRLTGVPLPCQKQPTMKDNREHSGDIHMAPELVYAQFQSTGTTT